MILDHISRAHHYEGLGERFKQAFAYLKDTDFSQVPKGRYDIDGDTVFALVNEYDTVDASGEKMEAHKAHIDVQFIVEGEELVGHDFLLSQQPSVAYDPQADFMLFSERPAFFSRFSKDLFAVFFPEDLHMPNIRVDGPVHVRKVVVKIRVAGA
jgi:YhcH/YjgK/YiaL family protein